MHLLQLILSLKENMMIQKFPVELNHSKLLLSLHKNISLFYHKVSTPLHNDPKKSYNKEDNPKTNKVAQYVETDIQQD